MTALAQATGTRLEWLATGTGPMRSAGAGFEEEGAAFSVGQAREAPSGGVLIPRYEARASAGIGTPLDPGWVSEKVLFSADFIRKRLRRKPENLALIECSGDSMEPTLHDGDELLVDTTASDLRSGAIYILRVAGALLAKRVQPRLDGTLMIISDNTRYPPEVFQPSETSQLDIVGEVIWRSGSLRP
ncbi:MAG: helix-turn-helix transcriptional regulator [Roseococcus sp.]